MALRGRAERWLRAWARRPLGERLTGLLLASSLLPLAIVGVIAVLALHRLAVSSARAVREVQTQTQRAFLSTVAGVALRQGQDLAHVQEEALALGTSARFLFDHPSIFPGVQQGNSPFEARDGALLNQAGSPVGVFVPAGTALTPSFWDEVALLTHVDPFLETLYASRSPASILRLWVLTPDGMIRTVPDPGYGHAESPVGPATLFTAKPLFQQATPQQDPRGVPVWTAPYADPAGGPSPIASVVVPVRDAQGAFRAVVGADISLAGLEQSIADELPGEAVALLSEQGVWIAGSPEARALLGHPGTAAALAHAASGSRSGVVPIEGGGTRWLTAAARLDPPGWLLAVAVPAQQALGPAVQAAAAARATERSVLLTVVIACLALALGLVWAARGMAEQTSRPLRELARRMRRTGAATEASRDQALPRRAEAELLTREFEAMEARLAESARRLEAEVRTRARLEQAAERQMLEQRNALARDVHDSLAQGFVAALMLAEAAAVEAAGGNWDAVRGRLARLADVAREGLGRARVSVRDLLPPLDLRGELQRELDSLADDLDTELEVEGQPERLGPEVRAALVGIAREGLSNVRRHARACRVEVRLCVAPERATLEIRDDGQGFVPGRLGEVGPDLRGFGLVSMRARAAAAGGRLGLDTAPGAGTRLWVEIPLDEGGSEARPGLAPGPRGDGGA